MVKINDILTQINWLDIVVAIILMRTIYTGAKRGFVIEIFKVFATILATYVAINYFNILSDLLSQHSPLPLDFTDFTCFTALILLCLLLMVPIRDGFLHFIKIEAVNILNKWGGAILGLLRGILSASLIILVLEFSTVDYFIDITTTSLTGLHLSKIAPGVYTSIQERIIMKFIPGEKLNKVFFEVMDEVEK